MTAKQANDVWLVLTSRAIFRHWSVEEFKDDPAQMREFVVKVMQTGGVRRATKIYDWATGYLNSKSREKIAEEIMEYPELIAHWAANPIWQKTGLTPPWTLH